MIGGEHRKERLSERLEDAQNQPKNRGYLVGTEVRSGGYTAETLAGNWFEERADAAFYDGSAVVPTENAKLWTTSYREMTGPVAAAARATGALPPPPQDSFDQTTMMAVVDKIHSRYPSHQPHLNSQQAAQERDVMATVSQKTYVPPAEAAEAERVYVAPVLGGSPGAQATGVLMRLRVQLALPMPNRSAFPGNVMRAVRQALTNSSAAVDGVSAGATGDAEVNAQELRVGLATVGVEAVPAECTALIRFFDTKGKGTASVRVLVARLRGELTDRRLQLIRSVYAMLSGIALADKTEGRGDGLVRLQRVTDLIDVSQLPDVQSGAVTAEAARAAFLAQWSATNVAPSSSSSSPSASPTPEASAATATTTSSNWIATMAAARDASSFTSPSASITGTMSSTARASAASATTMNTCRAADGMLISEAMFIDFFSDASFEVATEGGFELLMRNVWHLSGGNGVCENTSCRRVEVLHLNGRMSREEVKNDLAIPRGDAVPAEVVDRLVRATLEKQGIKDIKSIRPV